MQNSVDGSERERERALEKRNRKKDKNRQTCASRVWLIGKKR